MWNFWIKMPPKPVMSPTTIAILKKNPNRPQDRTINNGLLREINRPNFFQSLSQGLGRIFGILPPPDYSTVTLTPPRNIESWRWIYSKTSSASRTSCSSKEDQKRVRDMLTPRSTNLKKSLFHGNNFLGGRQDAFVLRTEACKHLASSPKNVVTLDFEGIWGVSHSFADELLASLSDMLGEEVSKRVKFVGCDEDLVEFLARVGRMHKLHMPVLQKSRCEVEVKPLVAVG